MNYLIMKYCLTAAIVVLASELTKSDERLGGLVAALPLVTVLTLVWLYIENQPISKISSQAYYTFWYVIPTLPMFLVFSYLLPKLGFWMSLLSSIGVTLVIIYFYTHIETIWHPLILSMQKRWDIFCRIVDNFGDIGVCWRLAKQLQSEHGLQVRLWVDDWAVAEHFIPALKKSTPVDGVSIHHWHEYADFSQAADVVIEAFAGGLPPEYLTAMQAQKSKWVNLDYLTAEAWVDDFHGKPSPQANGMVRYFYFPGFTEKSGGLLRENNIIKNKIPTLNQKHNQHNTELKVSLFCYPRAPIHALLNTIARSNLPTLCYVPHSTVLPKVAAYFNRPSLQIGDIVSDGNLTVQVLTFLSQEDYDQLLADCDVNFVRGEDSWVRAIWAAKPFIWQPYFQAEDTHLIKLEAFLSKFYGLSDFEVVHQMHHAWLTGNALASKWINYLSQLDTIADHTRKQVNYFNKQQDLAEKLVFFANNSKNCV